MKPVVIDLFKGHRYLPAFVVMQNIDEFTSPEIAIEIRSDFPNDIPPLHTVYKGIGENSDSIQNLLFEEVLPYYYSIVEKTPGFRVPPRIIALIITNRPFNGEEK